MTGNLGAVGPCRVCTFVSCRRPIRPWAGFHLNVFFCEGIGEPAGDYSFSCMTHIEECGATDMPS